VIEPSDMIVVAGLPVTTPLRTAVDLARFSEKFGDRESRLVAELMRIGEFGGDECSVVLNRRRNLPDKRVALERLLAAAGLPGR